MKRYEWQWARIVDIGSQGRPELLVLNKLVEISLHEKKSQYAYLRGPLIRRWFKYRFRVISPLELLAREAV